MVTYLQAKGWTLPLQTLETISDRRELAAARCFAGREEDTSESFKIRISRVMFSACKGAECRPSASAPRLRASIDEGKKRNMVAITYEPKCSNVEGLEVSTGLCCFVAGNS